MQPGKEVLKIVEKEGFRRRNQVKWAVVATCHVPSGFITMCRGADQLLEDHWMMPFLSGLSNSALLAASLAEFWQGKLPFGWGTGGLDVVLPLVLHLASRTLIYLGRCCRKMPAKRLVFSLPLGRVSNIAVIISEGLLPPVPHLEKPLSLVLLDVVVQGIRQLTRSATRQRDS
jgi:hypothetical protein